MGCGQEGSQVYGICMFGIPMEAIIYNHKRGNCIVGLSMGILLDIQKSEDIVFTALLIHQTVETGNARFLENGDISESDAPGKVVHEKYRIHMQVRDEMIRVSISNDVVRDETMEIHHTISKTPLDENIAKMKQLKYTLPYQKHHQMRILPIMTIENITHSNQSMAETKPWKRFQRLRRSMILEDYVVYL